MCHLTQNSFIENQLLKSWPHFVGPSHFPLVVWARDVVRVNSARGKILQNFADDQMARCKFFESLIVSKLWRIVRPAIAESQMRREQLIIQLQKIHR